MPARSYRSLHKILIIILVLSLSISFAFAQNNNLREEAKIYRDRGYEAQIKGDFDRAMSYYQKAIEIDPVYVAAYNDLGVVFEMKGLMDKAEASYMKCLKLDPYYQSAYFNLASLYERKGDLRKAANYWKKRIQIGDPDDPWTKKAQQRFQNIGMLVEDIGQEVKHQQMLDLIKSVPTDKDYVQSNALTEAAFEKAKKEKAKIFFINAKESYARGNYESALKDATTAQYFDPSSSDIQEFVDKTRKKILSANSQ